MRRLSRPVAPLLLPSTLTHRCLVVRRKLAMRQLKDLEPRPCYGDYETLSQQLEAQRESWDAATSVEFAAFAREQMSSADQQSKTMLLQQRTRLPGRALSFSPERGDASQLQPRPSSLPRIVHSNTSLELERSKKLTAESESRIKQKNAEPSAAAVEARQRRRVATGMLHTRVHMGLAGCPELQHKVMDYVAQLHAHHWWDERRRCRQTALPAKRVLRVSSADSLVPATANGWDEDGGQCFVRVWWNGSLVGETPAVSPTTGGTVRWDLEVPLLLRQSRRGVGRSSRNGEAAGSGGAGEDRLKLQVFALAGEKQAAAQRMEAGGASSVPDFLGHCIFDGSAGLAELTSSADGRPYPLQRDGVHDVEHVTATGTYIDPFNKRVGGVLQLALLGETDGAAARSATAAVAAVAASAAGDMQGKTQAPDAPLPVAAVMPASAIDFSFCEISEPFTAGKTVAKLTRRAEQGQVAVWDADAEPLGAQWQLRPADAVRLSNNQIESLEGLPAVIRPYLFLSTPLVLQSLDLSFNRLRTLDREVIEAAPNLHTLYLHTNLLEDYTQVKKLGRLRLLERLSLHNNPVNTKALQNLNGTSTGVRDYRVRVLAAVPWLRELDFSTVTKAEFEAGVAHRQAVAAQRKKVAAAGGGRKPGSLPSPLRTMLGRQAGGRPVRKA